MPEMVEAREKGVLFDIGHGCGSFSFKVGQKMIQDFGFLPDIISSDIHMFSINGPVYDLPTTMSKFLALGMPLMEIIRATTATPAKALGLQEYLGNLSVGRVADISIMKIEEGIFKFDDAFGQTLKAKQKLTPIMTIKKGKAIWSIKNYKE